MIKQTCLAAFTAMLLLGATSFAGAQSFERGIDRPGSDMTRFSIRGGPNACQAACGSNRRCAAWTYVRAGVQASAPQCWLKNAIPSRVRSDCCVSGVM